MMAEMIEKKAKEISAPLITHAEDAAIGSVFNILMSG
jgi:hypothetical protein